MIIIANIKINWQLNKSKILGNWDRYYPMIKQKKECKKFRRKHYMNARGNIFIKTPKISKFSNLEISHVSQDPL